MSIAVDRIINQGTDYEFSVSESIADLITHGKFTESELGSYMTCGYIDNRVQGIVTPNLSLSQMGDYIDSCMFVPSAVTGFSADYSWNKQFPDDFQYYKRNLLVYSEANINNGQYLTDQDYTKWYIVLDIDIKKFYLKDTFRTTDTIAGFTYTDSNGESVEINGSYNNSEYQSLWQDDNTATNLFVIGLSVINDKMYFYMDNPHNQAYPKPLNSCAVWYDGGIKGGTGGEFITDVTGSADISFMPVLNGLPDYTNGQENQTPSQEYISGFTNSNGEFFEVSKNGHGYAYYDATSISVRLDYIGAKATKGMRLAEIFAWAGFKFKFKNTWYKPIISGGIVTGYTDDMSEESEWDDMTNVTGNTVPSGPPTPPPPPVPVDDDYTDMDLGISNITLGGLTKYAILSKSELVALISDYNSNNAMTGSNFSNHIICLYRLGFPASSIATTTTGNIVMVRSAGDVDFTSQANTYNLVTKQTVFIDAGGINVPRMTNTFYDFSPYSSYELYIPGCGWIPLPDNVAGRSIHVYIIFDLPTCSAKGIVRIAGGVYGGTTIATVNGIIGASCPFTIGENGQQRAAIMSANAQVASGIATGIVGGALANPYMAVSGGSNLLGGLINAYTAGNTNYVSTKGGAADFSMFGDGGRAVLKINSPVIDSVVNNSDFGHTVGYMCNEIGQLNSFHGFTVCTNPHIHISATSTEKEEIKRLLEEGVILP